MPYSDLPGSFVCFSLNNRLRVVAKRGGKAPLTWSFVIENNSPDTLGNPSWRFVDYEARWFQDIMQALLDGLPFRTEAEWQDEVRPGILKKRREKLGLDLATLNLKIGNMTDPAEEADSLKYKLLLERNRVLEELKDIDETLEELEEDGDG